MPTTRSQCQNRASAAAVVTNRTKGETRILPVRLVDQSAVLQTDPADSLNWNITSAALTEGNASSDVENDLSGNDAATADFQTKASHLRHGQDQEARSLKRSATAARFEADMVELVDRLAGILEAEITRIGPEAVRD